MKQTNLEAYSKEVLDFEAEEYKRYTKLYVRMAKQSTMSDDACKRLSHRVDKEVESLDKGAANLKKAYKWAQQQSDELKTRLKEGQESDKRTFIVKRAPANSVIDLEEERGNHFAKGINFYKIALICISGSFFGVLVELLWCLLRHGYIESRAGLVYGPFNLLYGVGAVVMTLFLYRYRNRSSLISFAGGMAVGSAVEYALSFGQELLFGSVSWDYSMMPFNLNGRICLLYSVFWGVLGVLWIKSLYPRIAKVILKLPNTAGIIITWALTIFLVFDGLISVAAVYRWSERINGNAPETHIGEFLDSRFPDARMKKVYANMEFNRR